MREEFKNRIDAYGQGDADDTVGLFAIIQWIESYFKPSNHEELVSLTLEFIKDMLAAGFKAGSPEYSATGYVPWKNQESKYVINRIQAQWQALGQEPNMGDIAWFGLPGYEYEKSIE